MSQIHGLILTDDLYESIWAELWLVYQIAENNHFWQIIVFCCFFSTFHWVHSNLKGVSYFYWQNKYSNLKTTGHIKPKSSCELNSCRAYSLLNICHCGFKASESELKEKAINLSRKSENRKTNNFCQKY